MGRYGVRMAIGLLDGKLKPGGEFLVPLALRAQTLAQAEQLWKARRFKEANEIFKQLEAKEPKNPDYKVRWGRMMLEHAQPTDAEDLFGEALKIRKDHAGRRARFRRACTPRGILLHRRASELSPLSCCAAQHD